MSDARSRPFHDIEWGKVVKRETPCPDAWRSWPPAEREACGAAIDRTLAWVREKWPRCVIVSDVATCKRYAPHRYQLFRAVRVQIEP